MAPAIQIINGITRKAPEISPPLSGRMVMNG
jgi:hypothetical protein